MNNYMTSISDYAASFKVSQVAIKVIDASLDLVDGALNKVGTDKEGTLRRSSRKIQSVEETKPESEETEQAVVDNEIVLNI